MRETSACPNHAFLTQIRDPAPCSPLPLAGGARGALDSCLRRARRCGVPAPDGLRRATRPPSTPARLKHVPAILPGGRRRWLGLVDGALRRHRRRPSARGLRRLTLARRARMPGCAPRRSDVTDAGSVERLLHRPARPASAGPPRPRATIRPTSARRATPAPPAHAPEARPSRARPTPATAPASPRPAPAQIHSGASCDDGNACTTGDACQADGDCAGSKTGTPVHRYSDPAALRLVLRRESGRGLERRRRRLPLRARRNRDRGPALRQHQPRPPASPPTRARGVLGRLLPRGGGRRGHRLRLRVAGRALAEADSLPLRRGSSSCRKSRAGRATSSTINAAEKPAGSPPSRTRRPGAWAPSTPTSGFALRREGARVRGNHSVQQRNVENEADFISRFRERLLTSNHRDPAIRASKKVLMVTAAWKKDEYNEGHVRAALNRIGITSKYEGRLRHQHPEPGRVPRVQQPARPGGRALPPVPRQAGGH